MVEPINLNKVRKAKLKQGQKAQAEENRVRFGVSTKTRRLHKDQRDKALTQLDQHRVESPEKQ